MIGMAVTAADLQFRPSLGRTSGGSAFAYGTDTALGGTMADAALRQGNAQQLLNNLFDNVTGAQTLATRAANYVDYRIAYIYNAASQTAFDVSVYIPDYSGTNKPINYWGEGDPATASFDPGDRGFVDIGVSNANAAGAIADVLATQETAPAVAVTWGQPTPDAPLNIGDLAATTGRPLFIRRTVPRGTQAFDAAEVDFQIHADTGE